MTTGDERSEVFETVEAIYPDLAAGARDAERSGSMQPALVERAKIGGLFRLGLARSLGGAECDPETIFSVIERLSHADGSGGWTIAAGNGTVLLAWLEPDVAREILGAGSRIAVSGVTAPIGRARPNDEGSFVVTGRWPYSTGCRHSEWFIGGVVVRGGARPSPLPPGRADWRVAWLPRNDVEIAETWDAAGLRGTGSDDVVADELAVPRERMCSPVFERARHDGPLYRLSLHNLVALFMAGVPSGIARRALDEFTERAVTKRRLGARRPLAEDEAVQVALAVAEGNLRAGRALFLDAVGEAWNAVVVGDECTLHQRAAVLLGAQTLARLATDAVDTVFSLAGASALLASNPLQRCFRDIHAVGQHVLFSAETLKQVSRVALGLRQPTFTL